MELLTHKCVVLLVLVSVRLGVGLCPLVICGRRGDGAAPWVVLYDVLKADLVLALGYSLAGGVLLATVFLHMIPEVRLQMHHFLPEHQLPVTELLVTAGFLLTFLLDEMIINLRSSSKVSPTKDADEASRPRTASTTAATPDTSFHILPRGALLSLHGLGQGMAVGLADTAASTWLMAAAAGVTGSMDSASTSARLLGCHQSSRIVVIFCVVVTFVMAMGVVVGTSLWYLGVEAAVLTVLRGVAAGNLLYQAVYELLTRDVRERAMGLLSLFVCLLGFLIILLLQLLDIKSLSHQYSGTTKPFAPSPQEPVEEPDYENNYPNDP